MLDEDESCREKKKTGRGLGVGSAILDTVGKESLSKKVTLTDF